MHKEFSYLIKLEGVGCSGKKGRKKTAYNTRHCKLKLAINTAAAFCFFTNCFALRLVQKISTVTNAFLSTNQLQNTSHSYGRPRFPACGPVYCTLSTLWSGVGRSHYFSFDFDIRNWLHKHKNPLGLFYALPGIPNYWNYYHSGWH